ncbi:MAG: Hsp20/alpha crystallin family protein [Saprospiraceae bacterium]|nr:Hsp20/alpha crystallin family protein [Saprospiraceae bacterium]
MKLSSVSPLRRRTTDPIDFWLNEFLAPQTSKPNRPVATKPAVNILEQDDKFQIQLAVPGFSKADFKIDVEDDRLLISLVQESEKADQEKPTYRRRGFVYGPFEKSFILNKDIDQKKIQANYDQGILSIELPKVAAAIKPEPKTISVG